MTSTIDGLDAAKLRIAWTTAPLSAAPAYTDVAADGAKISRIHIRRGRSSAIDTFEAGTMDVYALDEDRRFEPFFAFSPYYPVKTNRKIQFVPVYYGTDYPQFTGFTRKVQTRPNQFGYDPRTVLPCTDGFRPLSKTRKTMIFDTEELSGTRIMRFLDAANWPGTGLMSSSGHRALDTGVFTMQAQDCKDQPIREAAALVELSEGGAFFMAADGAAKFLGGRAVYTQTPYNTVQDTFGDALGELPYIDIATDLDDEAIHNKVTASVYGGATQTAIDQASIDEYFETVEPIPELLLRTNNEALDYAYWRLSRESQPSVAVEPIHVDPRTDPAALWPVVLQDNLMRRYRVRNRPRVGGAIREFEIQIQGIESDWDFVSGLCGFTFQLSIADTRAAWVLEEPGFALGVNTYEGR